MVADNLYDNVRMDAGGPGSVLDGIEHIRHSPNIHHQTPIEHEIRKGYIMSIKFNAIIHGCPAGQQSNATNTDPAEFRSYADFHRGDSKYVESPSKPGAKFIKEILPSGHLAYTFVRTGVFEAVSSRPGSNYAAITLFLPGDVKIQNEEEFKQTLKQWFEINILNNFTRDIGGGWLKWTRDAEYYIFRNNLDAQIGESLVKQFLPYLSTPEQANTSKATVKDFDDATQKLQAEIHALEQQLAAKRAELERLTKQA